MNGFGILNGNYDRDLIKKKKQKNTASRKGVGEPTRVRARSVRRSTPSDGKTCREFCAYTRICGFIEMSTRVFRGTNYQRTVSDRTAGRLDSINSRFSFVRDAVYTR